MDAIELPAPPKGFRKGIPVGVKLQVALHALGLTESEIDWDHTPPIQMRGWDPVANDTIPPSNDPKYLQILKKADHSKKTTGRKGESRLNAVHGDIAEIAKLRRIEADTAEFRKRVLTKGTEEASEKPAGKKSRWAKRPFSRGARRESSPARSEARDGVVGREQRNRRLPLRWREKAQER